MGGIKIEELTVRNLDGSVIAHYLMKERDNVQGQNVHTNGLIPLSPFVYFQSDSIHTMVFVADAIGDVYEVRETHKYNELVMTRLSHGSNN